MRTVREALKLPYAAISLREGEESIIAAESGLSVNDPLRLPLVYQGKTIGEFLLAPRGPGEEFTPPTDASWTTSPARHRRACRAPDDRPSALT